MVWQSIVSALWMGILVDISGILLAMGDTHSDLTHSDYDWGKHHGIAPQISSKREKIRSPEKIIDPLENSDGIATSPSFPASLQGCYELLHFLIGFIYIRCADRGCLSGQISMFFQPKMPWLPCKRFLNDLDCENMAKSHTCR